MRNIFSINNEEELTHEGILDIFKSSKLQTTPDDLNWIVFHSDKEFIQKGLQYLLEKDSTIPVHISDIDSVIEMNNEYLKGKNTKVMVIDKNYSGKLQGKDSNDWTTSFNKSAIADVNRGLENLINWYIECIRMGQKTYFSDFKLVDKLEELEDSFEKIKDKLLKNTKIVKGEVTVESSVVTNNNYSGELTHEGLTTENAMDFFKKLVGADEYYTNIKDQEFLRLLVTPTTFVLKLYLSLGEVDSRTAISQLHNTSKLKEAQDSINKHLKDLKSSKLKASKTYNKVTNEKLKRIIQNYKTKSEGIKIYSSKMEAIDNALLRLVYFHEDKTLHPKWEKVMSDTLEYFRRAVGIIMDSVITESTYNKLTTENSNSIGCDTLQELQTFLSKESRLVVGNAAILTTEGAYVSNVKNFFLDSIDNLLTKITAVKNNWLHDYKFKDRAMELRKLSNTIDDISEVPMSKIRTLSVPVSLGMNGDYYTISNKIVNLPDMLSAHTDALKAFREELQKLIANRKGERLRISNKIENETFSSIDKTEDIIRTIIKHNDTKDLRKVEEVFPNLKVADSVKNNFVSACQGIVDKDTIGTLVKEVDETSEVLRAWSELSKESKERYGSNVIHDIGYYSDHLAKAVTNAGTLIALLDQHTNFFIRDIKIIEKSV